MADHASLIAAARAEVTANPGFGIDADRFAAHVDELAVRWGAPTPALLGDALLAFAAAMASPTAIEQLERDVIPAAASALRAIGVRASVHDDCLQQTRILLLVGRADERPRLLDYRVQSTLRAWVRVVALREGLQALRGRIEVPLSDAVLASVPDEADDPELRYMQGETRDQLATAVTRALATLTPRERALLRYSLIDELGLDEIGTIYGAHKSSVSRWLSRAREHLWEGARELLAEVLGDDKQLSSLVRRLRSGLDLSLERLLAG